jgi:hypothetical protein
VEEHPDRQEDDERTEDDERPEETAVPPDAPVETPEADPRTEQAPDPGGPRPADPTSPASTEEQIREAFE